MIVAESIERQINSCVKLHGYFGNGSFMQNDNLKYVHDTKSKVVCHFFNQVFSSYCMCIISSSTNTPFWLLLFTLDSVHTLYCNSVLNASNISQVKILQQNVNPKF